MNTDNLTMTAHQPALREEMVRQRAAAAAVASAVLLENGWTAELGHPIALATKTFETAVGEKAAVAYLGHFDSEFYNCTLMADYQSEGRNATSNCGVLIPKDATADDVRRLVTQYVFNVDDAVAKSYAAALHADRPRPG